MRDDALALLQALRDSPTGVSEVGAHVWSYHDEFYPEEDALSCIRLHGETQTEHASRTRADAEQFIREYVEADRRILYVLSFTGGDDAA